MEDIKLVEEFWSNHPCGSDTGASKKRKEYFKEIERYRYSTIRSIMKDARFQAFRGKKVLEVGCGVGTDGRQFANNGAIYTGINVDDGSTTLAREAFELFSLPGTILKMNGERMEFQDNSFDHVYSFGVIHHTANPECVVKEMFRVCKPGGTFCVMLYNKSSVNYYFEIMFLRKIFRYLLMPSFAPGFISKVAGFDRDKLHRHREILLSEKMSSEKWISINTDGPDNPLSRVYSKKEAFDLFISSGFSDLRMYSRFFDKNHYGFLSKVISNDFADWVGNRLGWFRMVEGAKPLGTSEFS